MDIIFNFKKWEEWEQILDANHKEAAMKEVIPN